MMGFRISYKYDGMSLSELADALTEFELKLEANTKNLTRVELIIKHIDEVIK